MNEFLTDITRNISIALMIYNKKEGVWECSELNEDNIQDFSIDFALTENDLPSIGNAVSNHFSCTIIADEDFQTKMNGLKLENSTINPIINFFDENENLLGQFGLGHFQIKEKDISKRKLLITIEGYDIMNEFDFINYQSQLNYPNTFENVVNEFFETISPQLKNYFSTDILRGYYAEKFANVLIPRDVTMNSENARETLRKIATYIGTNATVHLSGKGIRFVENINAYEAPADFIIDEEQFETLILNGEKKEQKISRLGCVINKTQTNDEGEEKEVEEHIIIGDADGAIIELEKNFVGTTADLTNFYNSIGMPYIYTAFTLSSRGFPNLQLGNVLELHQEEEIYRFNIYNHNISYNGGLKSQFSMEAMPEEEIEVRNVSVGSMTEKVQTIKLENQQMIKAQEQFKKQIEQISEDMISFSGGGYIQFVDNDKDGSVDELLISDTKDYKSATNIWRWNKTGLSHSSNGYYGNYDTAITEDGKIVANAIYTSQLEGYGIEFDYGSIADWAVEREENSTPRGYDTQIRQTTQTDDTTYYDFILKNDGSKDTSKKLLYVNKYTTYTVPNLKKIGYIYDETMSEEEKYYFGAIAITLTDNKGEVVEDMEGQRCQWNYQDYTNGSVIFVNISEAERYKITFNYNEGKGIASASFSRYWRTTKNELIRDAQNRTECFYITRKGDLYVKDDCYLGDNLRVNGRVYADKLEIVQNAKIGGTIENHDKKMSLLNDSCESSAVVSGYITNSGKDLIFCIPTPFAAGNSVSFSKIGIVARHPNGGYLYIKYGTNYVALNSFSVYLIKDSAAQYSNMFESGSPEYSIIAGGTQIWVRMRFKNAICSDNKGTAFTNNVPVSVQLFDYKYTITP